jgi:two-component system LytT family response regulator
VRERLVIRSSGRIRLVDLSEIDHIEAAGNYVLVHAGGASHLLRETLTDLERRLDPRGFLRIHRSVLVNGERVREVRFEPTGDARVVLTDGSVVPLSRRYRRRFDEFLDRTARRTA